MFRGRKTGNIQQGTVVALLPLCELPGGIWTTSLYLDILFILLVVAVSSESLFENLQM